MFSKLSTLVATAFITLAAATVTIPITEPTDPQCCQSVVQSDSSQASAIFALLDVHLDVVVPVGLNCSPITIGGANCGATVVTCDPPEPEIQLGHLIAINCIPITI
ncbi:Hydrophobin [Mycena kentingensis (nom. inval.)]|nr:Hydrophobin [Mycena kentingensis (nom. inval.)]